MLRRVIIIILIIFLTGCVNSRQLGISDQDWKKMSRPQREQAIKGYRSSSHKKNLMFIGPDIMVRITGGTATMPPFTASYPFTPVNFKMRVGNCRRIPLQCRFKTHRVKLKVCYDGLTLTFDPSRYEASKRAGTLHIKYHPLWKRGIVYKNFSSSGYVRLKNVDIFIKTASKMAPVEDVHDTRD